MIQLIRRDNVLPPGFCCQVVGGYSGFMKKAGVGSGSRRTYNSGRKAMSHEMEPSLMLSAASIGLCKDIDGGVEGMEPTHCDLVCYSEGDMFTRHRDATAKLYTIIYFMNEGYEGGHLQFDSGDVFKDMPVGSAVAWKNTPDSYHQVTEVLEGQRYVLAHWMVAG